jgi:hypothetical protein
MVLHKSCSCSEKVRSSLLGSSISVHGCHSGSHVAVRRIHDSLRESRIHSKAPGADHDDSWTPFNHPDGAISLGFGLGDGTTLRPSQASESRFVECQNGVKPYEEPLLVTNPEEQCQECSGTGKTVCLVCHGKGRVNRIDKNVLPAGEWPKWCTHCIRCTGMTCCGLCLGTGKKREPIGFRVQ